VISRVSSPLSNVLFIQEAVDCADGEIESASQIEMPSFQDPEICRSVLESLQTGVCVVDLQKKIIFWSDGAERITGFLRHEVVGRPCAGRTLLHCDQSNCEACSVECPVGAAIQGAHPSESEGYLHHKQGHRVPVHVWAVPVRDAHGSIIGAVESFEDQHQAEDGEDREEGLKNSGCVDDVTGIANHAIMQSHLRETLGTFAELQVPFGALLLRVNGLELFRANFGAEAAACMLRMVAHTLELAVWRTDHIGRWADDQFLVILNGCSGDSLHSVGDRIGRMLANDGIEWWGEKRSLTVSIGPAAARPGDTAESILERARHDMEINSAQKVAPNKSAQSAASAS
jgi:diguanylate cyclase (GGDEF)-like protein/PAS domain S-box-containing protein